MPQSFTRWFWEAWGTMCDSTALSWSPSTFLLPTGAQSQRSLDGSYWLAFDGDKGRGGGVFLQTLWCEQLEACSSWLWKLCYLSSSIWAWSSLSWFSISWFLWTNCQTKALRSSRHCKLIGLAVTRLRLTSLWFTLYSAPTTGRAFVEAACHGDRAMMSTKENWKEELKVFWVRR